MMDNANYKLILDIDADELVREVNEHLAKGWLPQGGVAVDEHPARPTVYVQALLRPKRTSLDTTSSEAFSRITANVSSNKILSAADSGIVQNVIADAVVVTLPPVGPTTVGLNYTIRNGAKKYGDIQVAVSPNGSDQIIGNGFTPADNKDALNPKSKSKPGDEISLVSNGSTGWFVSDVVGVWAREA